MPEGFVRLGVGYRSDPERSSDRDGPEDDRGLVLANDFMSCLVPTPTPRALGWRPAGSFRCMWVRRLCASPGPTARQGSLYLIENDAGSAEARFTDLGTEAVGPNLLRGLYRAENLASLGGEPQEFRPAVARIVLVDC